MAFLAFRRYIQNRSYGAICCFEAAGPESSAKRLSYGSRAWHAVKGLWMPDGSDSVLVFGPFRLFPAQRRLEKDGKPLRLGGRALDILTVLAERAGEVVSNRVLLESVWQDVTVEESSLRFHIKNLRKTLGDSQSGTRYVSNVPGRGYCFVAPTTRSSAGDSPGTHPPARRYALPR